MLNPEITCGLFLSKSWKSSFFKLPIARPCESRTTTGTSTEFTLTTIFAGGDGGAVSLGCCAERIRDKTSTPQNRAMTERDPDFRIILTGGILALKRLVPPGKHDTSVIALKFTFSELS